MNGSLLLIDIGNTRTAMAVAARGGRDAPSGVIHLPTRTATKNEIADALRRLGRAQPLMAVMGASVVPQVNRRWEMAVRTVTGMTPEWVDHSRPWNFKWNYPCRKTMGADRMVNLCGALRRHRPPLVVLDFGTALTVDVIDAAGAFVGGVIAPGFAMLASAPAERTALLPCMDLRIGRMPARALGRSTRAALRSGLLLGYRGLVRELIAAASAPFGPAVTICATGGYAAPIMAALPGIPCSIHPRLTLEGLATAYRLGLDEIRKRCD